MPSLNLRASDYLDIIGKTPTTPARIGAVANAVTFAGVVRGALPNSAARQANGTAMQAFLDWCGANGCIAHFPPGRYEYECTTVQAGRNAGLQVKKEVIGMKTGGPHPIFGTRFVQYSVNHPILTVGDISDTPSSLQTGAIYEGVCVNYGVSQTGQTSAIGLLFGRVWNSRLGDFTVDASPYVPYIGFQVGVNAGTFFFSNVVGLIRVAAGQVSIFKAAGNGTGCVWLGLYFGGGGPGARAQCSGSVVDFDLTGAEFGTVLQFNVEWARAGQHYPLVASKALLLDIVLFHCEGCKPYGFDTPVLLASFAGITISQLSVSDLWCESSAAGTNGSTPCILKTDGLGSAIVVKTARLYWQGTGIHAELSMATPLVMHKGTATFGELVTVEVGPTTIGGGSGGITGAISLDATLLCTARGTAGALWGFSKYVYDKTRSYTEGAIIECRDANITILAAHRRAQPRLKQALTADRKCILSNNMAASGIGNVPVRLAGDKVNAVREAVATGAFNWLIRDSADAVTGATLAAASAEANLMFDTTGAWDAS